MPGLSIIHVYNPRAKIVADLSVAMPPSVYTKQIFWSTDFVEQAQGQRETPRQRVMQHLAAVVGIWAGRKH